MNSESTAVDTLNRFMVAAAGVDQLAILRLLPGQRISKADALCLAAWLVAIADPTTEKFKKVLAAVLET